MMPGPMRLAPYVSLLRRNPDFTRLYVAQLASFAGDWFATVALLGLALEVTGSSGLAALVLALQTGGFAAASPDRVSALVYLDAVYDHSDIATLLAGSPPPARMNATDSASP